MNDDAGTTTMESGSGRSRLRRFLPFLILLGGVGLAAALVVSRPAPERSAAPRMAPMVSTAPLTPRTSALTVEGAGTVRPAAEITLSAQVSGRVTAVSQNLVRGGVVRRGETLIQIERDSYLNAVAIARAEVQQRRVDVALAAQNQTIAQEEFELLRARTGRGAVSDTTLSARLARQQPQFEAAEASLARAEAQLADAMLNLNRTTVTAPFSGRVRSETVDVGQVITTGQAVADIYGTDAVEVDISLSTRQASLIDHLWNESGAEQIPAKILAEFGGTVHSWDGFVSQASGALDPTTRTVEVVVRVPGAFETSGDRPPLLIGSYVRAVLTGRTVDGYYAVPRSALRDGPAVWVAEGGQLSARPVQVLQEIQDTVLIRGDLAAGSNLIISDLTVATDGMAIRLPDDEVAGAGVNFSDAGTGSPESGAGSSETGAGAPEADAADAAPGASR